MCQIIYKPAGKTCKLDNLDVAQTKNDDGYGVTWYEDGELTTIKTMNYDRFRTICSSLDDVEAVIHLRYATKGITCVSNNHPFDIPSGVLFHNGTISGLGNKDYSDTQELADLITQCDYKYIEDIQPLIEQIVGTTLNRLVFFEDDGNVTIINEELGVWEDGVWYSNKYHHKDVTRSTPWKYKSRTQQSNTSEWTGKDNKNTDPKKEDKVRVFVYGTLKRGYTNNRLISNATFIGKAKTVSNWIMIGNHLAFPYVLRRDHENGSQIKGEVYEVDQEGLKKLDLLEGVPSHYTREKVYVQYTANNELISENVYIYVKANGKNFEIPKGEEPIEEWDPRGISNEEEEIVDYTQKQLQEYYDVGYY